MEAYATVADVESGWRKMSASERERAEALLDYATAYIASMLRRKGVEADEDDEVQMAGIRLVTCRLVQTNIGTPVPEQGTMWSEYADDTAREFTPTKAGLNFYLYDSEKRLLGISGGRFGVAAM